MEQALSSRTPSLYAPLNGGNGLAAAVGRDQYVLLRIPDCSTQLAASTEDDHAESLAIAMGLRRVAAILRGLVTPWRRPRNIVLATLGVGLAVLSVALFAATHQRGVDHADGDQNDASIAAPEWTTVVSGRANASTANALASALEDAPPFSGNDTNQARPNQPATVGKSSAPPAGGKSTLDEQGRKPANTAHLEQRIDRVPTQY